MLSPLGCLLGYMDDTNCVIKLGFNWVIWAELCIIVAHMSCVCQPRSHLNLKLACRGGMFSQERSFDEVRILLQIKIIYTGDIV